MADHAKSILDSMLMDQDTSAYYDAISENEYDKRGKELTVKVNEELANLDLATRRKLIQDLSNKYPDWYPNTIEKEDELDPDLAAAEEEFAELGLDGTFWSSFKAVFGLFDILWFVLGIFTAYSVAFKQGGGGEDA